MEYLKGNRIRDILNNINEEERNRICKKIGENIAKFHNNDIIHGDITTSNMILLNDRVHFIDFGLGEKNTEIEAKGVDLHVLMEAIDSTHSKYSNCFKYVLEGYKKELKKDPNLVIKKIEEIVKRGRYK
jgi:Kae1-associated kinase Bud32